MTVIPHSESSTSNTSSPVEEIHRNGVVRRGGVRGPRRHVRPTSAGNHHVDTATQQSRPQLVRRRSASCSDLDWLKHALDWQTVESSPYLSRSGSYKSVYADGPVLDIRHDCVKSSSPTIVHQQNPHDITPLVAEVLQCDNSGVVQDSVINPGIQSKMAHMVKHTRPHRKFWPSRPRTAPHISIQ